MTSEEALPAVTIYTDGACSPNPGPGGWGAVFVYKTRSPREISGFGGETTNNRMELTAVVEALSHLDTPHRARVVTDSQYVKNGITSWVINWRKNNWQTADKKAVKNKDLWQQLLAACDKHHVSWEWVRGHTSNRWNNRADELAVAARKTSGSSSDDGSRPAIEEDEKSIHFFTGVTCKHSTGQGAWCVIFTWKHHVKVMGDTASGMTANQLYLCAVSSALKTLTRNYPVIVHTYSGYLMDGATNWLSGWKRRNWKTREGSEVSNKKQWQELSAQLETHQVRFMLGDKEQPLCHMVEAKEIAKELEGGSADE